MNVNFGLLPSLSEPLRKKAKKEMMAQRALADMEAWVKNTERGEAFIPLDIDPDGCSAVAR